LCSGKHQVDNMDEIQHLATLLKTDPDNLNGWHRLSQLVDDPQRKRDCQNQITRLENKNRGFDEIVPCENCGTWMLIYDDHRKRQKAATCLSCGAQKILETYEQEELSTSDAITIWVSIASILGGNFLPVIGVLYSNWDAASIVILYWIENLIIGFYTVLKMRLTKTPSKTRSKVNLFVVYGALWLVDGIVVVVLFLSNDIRLLLQDNDVIKFLHSEILWSILMSILVLFVSHGILFVQNIKKYAIEIPEKFTREAFLQIIPIHFMLVVGALLNVNISGGKIYALLLLVVLKTLFELVLFALMLASQVFRRQMEV
jgi:hypothetical protein